MVLAKLGARQGRTARRSLIRAGLHMETGSWQERARQRPWGDAARPRVGASSQPWGRQFAAGKAQGSSIRPDSSWHVSNKQPVASAGHGQGSSALSA